MKLKNILLEASYTSKAQKFLDTIRLSDNKIKDLRDIEVEGTPRGNWEVYYKRKKLMVVNGNLLDEPTIMKYGLEKR